MDLRLYNTLTRQKQAFSPLDPNTVRMYVCGPTVYDFAHIGNARPVIVFDVLFRLLRHVYGADHVTYVRNITDVDDKINARALRDFPDLPLNDAIRKVTEATAAQFHADVRALGCLPPTHEPRATDFVLPRADGKADMVTLIERLIARGHAYEAGGEVLFDTQSMPDYGQLSGRKLEDQQAGARVAVDAHKKNAADFVLWKRSSADEPGWDSPWGRGRPGWHIECSAMSAAYLGEVFDIHGGGLDLIFPHHENEIAQSRCAHGTHAMAQVWMHNGFLQVEGEKMSKSLGNFVTINELLETDKFGGRKWPAEVVRLAMLKTHYRQPIDWTVQSLEEAFHLWISFGNIVREHMTEVDPDSTVLEALADDLNLPAAIGRLHELRDAATKGDQSSGRALTASLRLLGFYEGMFGLKLSLSYSDSSEGMAPDTFVPSLFNLAEDVELHRIADHLVARGAQFANDSILFLRMFILRTTVRDLKGIQSQPSVLWRMAVDRNAARGRKDFKESDRIRDELSAIGVVLKDGKDADGNPVTTWEIAR